MSNSDSEDKLSKILSEYNPSFHDGFAKRVMEGVEAETSRNKNEDIEFYKIFKLVALSGVAAIILLLFTVYFHEGSFTADAFYGLHDYTPDEPLLTSLNF